MVEFVVCSSCQRHVKRKDARCPFCASAMAVGRVPLGIAAAVAVGLGVSAPACERGGSSPVYGAPLYDSGVSGGTGGAATSGDAGSGGTGGAATSGDAGSGGAGGDTATGVGGAAIGAYGSPPFDAGTGGTGGGT